MFMRIVPCARLGFGAGPWSAPGLRPILVSVAGHRIRYVVRGWGSQSSLLDGFGPILEWALNTNCA